MPLGWLMLVIPALWEAETGQEFKTSLDNTAKLHLYQKYKKKKISQMWWCTPVIPATRVAEAGESLEPGR